jgi:hypothetical protein
MSGIWENLCKIGFHSSTPDVAHLGEVRTHCTKTRWSNNTSALWDWERLLINLIVSSLSNPAKSSRNRDGHSGILQIACDPEVIAQKAGITQGCAVARRDWVWVSHC